MIQVPRIFSDRPVESAIATALLVTLLVLGGEKPPQAAPAAHIAAHEKN